LLESDPFIRQAILLGDGRPFIATLIVPDKRKIAAELDKDSAVLSESEIGALLQSGIDRINSRLENHEKIGRFVVMAEDFSDQVRSVTVFQKIKIDRKAVEQRYRQEIEEIYRLAGEAGR
jgi:long-chain acyl-CoA synthetase